MTNKKLFWLLFIVIFIVAPIPLGPSYSGGPGPMDELGYKGIQWIWFSGLHFVGNFIGYNIDRSYEPGLGFLKFLIFTGLSLLVAFILQSIITYISKHKP